MKSGRTRLVFCAIGAWLAAGSLACGAAGQPFDEVEADAGSKHVWPSKDSGADGAVATGDAATKLGDGGVLPDGASFSGPSADECLDDWALYDGGCAAPVITSSYVGNGCVGTTGWFVTGNNFQLRQHNSGIADYGPQSIGANGNQMNWNVITPTELCVTVSASSKSAWVGHSIYVVNPDGKSSNAVTVADDL